MGLTKNFNFPAIWSLVEHSRVITVTPLLRSPEGRRLESSQLKTGITSDAGWTQRKIEDSQVNENKWSLRYYLS